ncbi:hypothetical protein GDO86_011880 [Hymenochirus boettgeri]|uniref:SKI/SNO/DAC domain-containing protein n=1 Tax=Hymenochirus boettgeri TaxID=247094 RepID=A0A8T2JHW8_9PIPI|nr:hypothetical protein GDO86_011880 [Hymenochirus boettgeri]
MGDPESGYEVVDGVKLGYLVIKGKQMFALSQVFTDLLKNIPRTTVHKRMDHLKVKKHQCDVEELRKLKALNSIAFHAAKCTLISREDVEALYTSCKTERVLRTKRRRLSGALVTKDPGEEQPQSPDPYWSLWKEDKVWLGLDGAAQPRKGKDWKSEEQPAADLPRFFSKYTGHSHPQAGRDPCKPPLDYGTAPAECVAAFHSSLPYLRGVLCTTKHPAYYYYQPAQPKLASPPAYRHKRKRQSADTRRLFLLPKPYRSKGTAVCLERIHLIHGFCSQHLGTLQESSDSESSSYSDLQANDSDLGSSFSSSSNSASSDEEEDGEEEEGSQSDSSEVSSEEEESSSDSDSSSGSSQVSVESIRFRRTTFSNQSNKQHLGPGNPLGHFPSPGGVGFGETKAAQCEIKCESQDGWGRQSWRYPPPGVSFPPSLQDIPGGGSSLSLSGFPSHAKRTDPTISCVPALPNASPQQRLSREAKQCLPPAPSQCGETKTPSPLSSSNCLSASAEVVEKISQISDSEDFPSPPPAPTPSAVHGGDQCTDFPSLHHVTIKTEDSQGSEEYGAPHHKVLYECNVPKDESDSDGGETKTQGGFLEAKEHLECTDQLTTSHNDLTPNKAPPCTLTTPKPEEGDYKYGAKVRKNYRTLVLGKRSPAQSSPSKPNLKSARSPRSPGKSDLYEGTLDRFTVSNRRKRLGNNVASSMKRPFNFMANFPCPPSLIIGKDGDLLPAYSLNSTKDSCPPHKAHPIWKWQLGGSPIPLPPSHKFRTYHS